MLDDSKGTYDDQRTTELCSPLREKANDHSLSIRLFPHDRIPHVAILRQLPRLQTNLLCRLEILILRDDVIRIIR